jgi:hypothetical protein
MKVIMCNSTLSFRNKKETVDAVISNIRDTTDTTRACYVFPKNHTFNTIKFDNDVYDAILAYNEVDSATLGTSTWNILSGSNWGPSPIDVSTLHTEYFYAVLLRHKNNPTQSFTSSEVEDIITLEW